MSKMSKTQTKFEEIINDKEIIERYKEISKFEKIHKEQYAHHDLQHVINVTNMVEKLLKDLNYDDEFIEEAKIASILHDTGCNLGKDDHEIRSYEFAKDYIERNNIELTNKEMVLGAIKLHRNGFETDNIMALTLIISDKLDIKYTRVAEEGAKLEGIKEYLYIKDIEVNINENILQVNFVCDDKINKKAAEEYYFTKKVFKAINAFAEKMNLTPHILLNNEKWEF